MALLILASLLLLLFRPDAKTDRTNGRTGREIVKKLDFLAVTIAMLFVAVAFAGGVSRSGADERAHYCDPELIATSVMSGMTA